MRCALAVAGASAVAVGASAASQQKPHVLLVLADDYGWAGLGYHRRGGSLQGRLEVQTPNLDALIDEGILLDRHYAYKICSPSRSSLQSGRLPVHVNAVNTGVTVTNASDPVSGAAGIPRNMTGLASKLRQAGYRTHMVGKWDAGMATPEHTPWGRGYETWTGYFQHANDYWTKGMPIQATGEVDNCLNRFTDLFTHNATYRGGVRDGITASEACTKEPAQHEECYEEALFKERALAVISGHDTSAVDSPMFLFYAFHLLHTPLQVPERYLKAIDDVVLSGGGKKFDSANRRLYAAMTMYMDEAVGEVVAALKAKDMWDNTLVVFTADNGGAIYMPGSGNNHPLKGGKYNDFEGGVRVNAFVSGGFVPKEKRGSVFEGVVSIADWYGTLCELAGVDATDDAAASANEWLRPRGLPLLPPIDSVSQWGFILNGSNGRPVLHLSEQAVLRWPFKLITGSVTYARWTGELYPNCTTIAVADADHGAIFTDLKFFDRNIPPANTPAKVDEVLWVDDCGSGCLFNVEQDPTEHLDLSKDPNHAGLLAELQESLKTLNAGNFNPYRGEPTLEACFNSVDNGGFYGPFLHTDGWYSEVPRPSMAQRIKNTAAKEEIRLLNSRALVDGLERLIEELNPVIRVPWTKKMDKCLEKEEAVVI